MSVLYILVPLALLLTGASVAAFFFAARGGQFDDVETPAMRVLFDGKRQERPEPPGDDAPG